MTGEARKLYINGHQLMKIHQVRHVLLPTPRRHPLCRKELPTAEVDLVPETFQSQRLLPRVRES